MQKVIPALLTADPAELKEKLAMLRGHTQWVHIDIADGTFVPNTTVALLELQEVYQFFNIEVHLLVNDPEKYFTDCNEVGVKRAVFHYEATNDVNRVLNTGKEFPFQIGMALNPETQPDAVVPYLQHMDSILVMSVHPGWQGQPFLPESLGKVKELKAHPECPMLGIDGGIGSENIKQAFAAGVDYAIVGSGIVHAPDPLLAFENLQELM